MHAGAELGHYPLMINIQQRVIRFYKHLLSCDPRVEQWQESFLAAAPEALPLTHTEQFSPTKLWNVPLRHSGLLRYEWSTVLLMNDRIVTVQPVCEVHVLVINDEHCGNQTHWTKRIKNVTLMVKLEEESLRGMDVWTKSHDNPSDSCQDFSAWIKVVERLTNQQTGVVLPGALQLVT